MRMSFGSVENKSKYFWASRRGRRGIHGARINIVGGDGRIVRRCKKYYFRIFLKTLYL